MILYNASLSNGLRNYTRFLTNTNSTTFSDLDINAALNSYYHVFVNEILQSMDDWDFQAEIATADLVANQQEYVFPSTILKIKSIEITYDGTNWYPVTYLDKRDIGKATDTTTISDNFTTSNPYADLMDNSLFLYPIPSSNITAGIKIWYEKEADELSDATDEPNIPEAYHKGLCYGASKDYFEKYLEVAGNAGKRDRMETNLEDIIEKMKAFYSTKNQERDYVVGAYDSDFDSEYGNTY